MKNSMQLAAIRDWVNTVIECVNAAPNGVPADTLYAMLTGIMTLDQFQRVMNALVQTGQVHKQGHLYTGKAYQKAMRARVTQVTRQGVVAL